jgi:hypothetical protein
VVQNVVSIVPFPKNYTLCYFSCEIILHIKDKNFKQLNSPKMSSNLPLSVEPKKESCKKNPKCLHGVAKFMCAKCRCGCRGGKQFWGTCESCGPGVCVHGALRCKECWLCEHKKWNSKCVDCEGYASYQAKIAGPSVAGFGKNDDFKTWHWDAEVEYYAKHPAIWAKLCDEVRLKQEEARGERESKRRKYLCCHGRRKYDCKVCKGY